MLLFWIKKIYDVITIIILFTPFEIYNISDKMKESISSKSDEIFSFGYDSSEKSEENIFNSSEANPENIFLNQTKKNPEQLSSKILGFPFILNSYGLFNLVSANELILGGVELSIIDGNLEKTKINGLILKLVVASKNKKSELILKEYLNQFRNRPTINFILNI